jgi:adenosylcobinamide kinase/adenosylcobinamide-phosphate guanylyltransferase
VVLVDCLTLLVSNILLSCENHQDAEAVEDLVRSQVGAITAACRERPGTVIIVSGEVGQGVVPEHALGRTFRDLLGMANQIVAAMADAVYLMVAGLPVEIKSLAATVATAAQAPAQDHEMLSAREIGSQ